MTPLLAALVTIAADLTSAGAIVAPRTGIVKKKSATAASRPRERVALLTDRLHVGAAPPRQGIKTSPKCQRESTAETHLRAVAIGVLRTATP